MTVTPDSIRSVSSAARRMRGAVRQFHAGVDAQHIAEIAGEATASIRAAPLRQQPDGVRQVELALCIGGLHVGQRRPERRAIESVERGIATR